MPASDVASLAREIDARCRLRGPFTLRSGQLASEYFDKYRFEADPALLGRVARHMLPLLPDGTQILGGLELGGVPIATVLSQQTGLPALFVRKQAKTYGTCKLAEGYEPTGRQVVLIEDVITTGGQVVASATALRELGATVTTVVCAIDRSPPRPGALAQAGIEVRSVLTKEQLDLLAGGG